MDSSEEKVENIALCGTAIIIPQWGRQAKYSFFSAQIRKIYRVLWDPWQYRSTGIGQTPLG
jgi:hypothetical protein